MASDAVSLWLRGAGRHRLLTPSEEIELGQQIQAWRSTPDPSPQVTAAGQRAREKMLNGNLRLVASMAKKYKDRTQIPFEDLLQVASIGCLTAIDKFDPSKGYKFSTYAFHWIRQAITRGMETIDPGCGSRLPVHTLQATALVKRAVAEFTATHRRGPNSDELASLVRDTGISRDCWDAALPWLRPTASLNAPLPHNPELTQQDLIASDCPSPEDELLAAELREGVARLLGSLNPREATAVAMRYGIQCPPAELGAIGAALGISSERARQILAKGMRKLRDRNVPAPAEEAA
ncbi:sigma-70 family RNA polymerase sigma factor [Leptolyngbya sp. CCNP1308]|uniref:sigma-70 family RNA polymerase sigma factor n=1 Tax=Leptolyngbya sp. CCNP1308 TaxID=3110255 RepID=UPI002B2054D7|nr:sigma-70 family RNA polymerase sigma factor [Leptolyngbya sp. CCNP1308]MEA5448521.1 sigma-70 family RNA polymerase sigma factor [Leptolyngbya sp. CCNP1308]